MSRLILTLGACALLVFTAGEARSQLRDVVLSHDGTQVETGVISYSSAGPGMDVDRLSRLEFALDYDPTVLEIQTLSPLDGLEAFPPDLLEIEYAAGRVDVVVEYDSPLVLQAGAQRLFEVQATALGELFQGERSEIRTTGRKPGTPVSWIDDPQNPDDIKVVVSNREVIGDSGVTCLAGDALGDGRVDAGDSGAVLRIVTGLIEAPDVSMRCGSDINQDGFIYTGDAVLILRKAVGFEDFLGRTAVAPAVEFSAIEGGARVRVSEAALAYGVTLRVRSVGGLGLRDVRSNSSGLASANVGQEMAILALASMDPIAGPDGSIEFEIDTEGVGQLVVDQMSLYGSDGAEYYENADPMTFDLAGPSSLSRLSLDNTPNPFNPSTTFWMELPVESRAVLELYDMRGRKLATLLDEVRPAGRTEYRFDGRAVTLPSGVYFARLRTGHGSTVHRVTLLK